MSARTISNIDSLLHRTRVFIIGLRVGNVPSTGLTKRFAFGGHAVNSPSAIRLIRLGATATDKNSYTTGRGVTLHRHVRLAIGTLGQHRRRHASARTFNVSRKEGRRVSNLPLASGQEG